MKLCRILPQFPNTFDLPVYEEECSSLCFLFLFFDLGSSAMLLSERFLFFFFFLVFRLCCILTKKKILPVLSIETQITKCGKCVK